MGRLNLVIHPMSPCPPCLYQCCIIKTLLSTQITPPLEHFAVERSCCAYS